MKEYRNEEGWLHRVNGPAREWDNGDYAWCYNGEVHRYYGCARSWGGSYWVFGREIE